MNMYGTYTCSCSSGYHLVDRGFDSECVGKSSFISFPKKCSQIRSDKDECSLHEGCQYKCINTDGSYYCDCPEGYEVQANGKCRDIDECSSTADCAEGLTCHNTPGGYKCINLTCPDEYKNIAMQTAAK